MNFYPLDYEANRQHRENLERELKMERLAHLARQHNPSTPLLKSLMANLGTQLVDLGERLQGAYQQSESAAEISSTSLPSIEVR